MSVKDETEPILSVDALIGDEIEQFEMTWNSKADPRTSTLLLADGLTRTLHSLSDGWLSLADLRNAAAYGPAERVIAELRAYEGGAWNLSARTIPPFGALPRSKEGFPITVDLPLRLALLVAAELLERQGLSGLALGPVSPAGRMEP